MTVTTLADDDVLDLLDYVWKRLQQRIDGLSDAEWAWLPAPTEPEISIRWRLDHITDLLTAPRNWLWLGLAVPTGKGTATAAETAASARSSMSAAYEDFRAILTGGAVDLDAEIRVGERSFPSDTGRAFVLHVADELIHHGAEAALLRDLYAAK